MIVVDHHHHPPPHYQRHNHDHQHAPVGPDMPILDQSDRLVPQSLRSLPCSLCFLGFRVLKVLNLRAELRSVIFFTQSKSLKPNFTP